MSELTLVLIRLSYLVILWTFVLAAISVIRSDMFGARQPRKEARQRQPKRTKPRRGEPTKVVIIQGDNAGESISLQGYPLSIGRASDSAIKLDDDYASTKHARIGKSGEQWFVEDLGSTNGTYVGSSRISQPTAIGLGTQIRIGKTVLELQK